MSDDRPLDPRITRRDFAAASLVSVSLVGCGATLVAGCGPRGSDAVASEPATTGVAGAWDGPSGGGDYRASNGTTWRTMEAGHRIRDSAYASLFNVTDTNERYDLIIVGGGFTGLGALHAFRSERPTGRCLLLDNQEIFGGYAKANDFQVDGYRLAGAQASLNFLLSKSPNDRGAALWSALGLPTAPSFAERDDGNHTINFSASTSGPLYLGEQTASVGYHFGAAGWVKDIFSDDLARAQWPEPMKQALLAMRMRKRAGAPSEAEARRLDAMSFADFATRDLKATPEALAFITQGMCITGPQISAYGARSFPGLERFADGSKGAAFADRFVSFPSGNTVIARAIVRAAVPGAFSGSATPAEAFGQLTPDRLDLDGTACRIRSRATVVSVRNRVSGDVEIVYERDHRLFRITAAAAVLGIGAWVAKHIVGDLPATHRAAMDQYLYSPMLMASVALRNWRFLDKLGFSAARWFDGFGFYASIRKPMIEPGGDPAPFHPDKPIVMTLYAPFPRPQLELRMQGPDARGELYATAFATFERRILDQLGVMFAPGGFDAKRDVAGIVLNRWGHAFVTPPPGFFFGAAGRTAPANIVDEPVGRIAFGQNGLEDWSGAAAAGRRAVEQVVRTA